MTWDKLFPNSSVVLIFGILGLILIVLECVLRSSCGPEVELESESGVKAESGLRAGSGSGLSDESKSKAHTKFLCIYGYWYAEITYPESPGSTRYGIVPVYNSVGTPSKCPPESGGVP